MKKLLIIAAVLAAMAFVFAACGEADDGGETPPPPPANWRDLGAFNLNIDGENPILSESNQRAWAVNGHNGTIVSNLTMEEIEAANYLVIETKGSASRDGFGGVHIVLNSSGTGWNGVDDVLWNDGWIGFPNTASETVYIVVTLADLNGWADFINNTTIDGTRDNGYIGVAYWPFANLGFQKGYILKTLTIPADAVDSPIKGVYLSKTLVKD
jgi:hypothetical protein